MSPAPSDHHASAEAHVLAAHALCAQIVRRRARNFYYGLRLTPEPKRSGIYAVYAWMRAADDEADAADPPEIKHARLSAFCARTEAMIEGGPPPDDDPVWTAFADTYRRFALDPADLRDMLAGLKLDLTLETRAQHAAPGAPPILFASRDELERYCYQVASTVGLVCITIWGLRPGVDRTLARTLAVRRGLAFQLTNILRDVAQDYDAGRIYLPGADLAAASLTPSDLRAWSDPARCASLARALAAWARQQYERSAPLDELVNPTCTPALRTMTRIYSGLLRVVEREPARIVGPRRIRLQSAHKAGIAVSVMLGAWMAQRRAVPAP